MHAAMKYQILNTIKNNCIITRENDTTGFTTYVIVNAENKHLLTVYYNWKYQNYFVHTANSQTVTEGTIPNNRLAMISKHHYDLQDIVTICFKVANNLNNIPQNNRRPVSDHFLQVAAHHMSQEERARFELLNKSIRSK